MLLNLSVNSPWPLVSLLPIAAVFWSGQVLSRSSSRVRSPCNSTGAVALRPQTALTGSDRPRTIPQREQGRPACMDETCCMLSGPFLSFRASRPAFGAAVAERQRERRRARRVGGAGGPAGRLETVQKVVRSHVRHRSAYTRAGHRGHLRPSSAPVAIPIGMA